ncbi:hypothetical protein J4468_03770 [Candidatus Woesearchaeota archaeon]|nr:hypothetical protein [Candidatus Woesearchaeota archaeon]
MKLFNGIKKGFQNFGSSITILINSILLLVVYIFGVGLTSLLAKVAGKKFMNIKTSKKTESYWEDYNSKKKSMDEHYRQF